MSQPRQLRTPSSTWLLFACLLSTLSLSFLTTPTCAVSHRVESRISLTDELVRAYTGTATEGLHTLASTAAPAAKQAPPEPDSRAVFNAKIAQLIGIVGESNPWGPGISVPTTHVDGKELMNFNRNQIESVEFVASKEEQAAKAIKAKEDKEIKKDLDRIHGEEKQKTDQFAARRAKRLAKLKMFEAQMKQHSEQTTKHNKEDDFKSRARTATTLSEFGQKQNVIIQTMKVQEAASKARMRAEQQDLEKKQMDFDQFMNGLRNKFQKEEWQKNAVLQIATAYSGPGGKQH